MINEFAMLQQQTVSQLERMLKLKQLQMESLLEVTEAINNNQSAEDLFQIYQFIMRAQMQVNRLAVFHHDEGWTCVGKYGIGEKAIAQIDVSQHLLRYSETTNLNENAVALAPFSLVIPVQHKNEALAYVLIGDVQKGTENDTIQERLKFIQTITNVIVVAIENKRLFKHQLEQESFKKELEVAQQVQSMLIPNVLPVDKNVEMSGVYMPHHNISGDYYDYIPLNGKGEEFLVCMADVSGKGMAAALLMANFQAMLRALAMETTDLRTLVTKLNRRLTENTKGEKYITLFIAKHNRTTRQLSYINAGHNPPVMSYKGEVTLLEKGCTILGFFDELPFIKETHLQLQANTVIVTYTDGLTELENEEEELFEIERVMDFIKTYDQLSMKEFNAELLKQIKAFKGNRVYTDDVSILSYRIF